MTKKVVFFSPSFCTLLPLFPGDIFLLPNFNPCNLSFSSSSHLPLPLPRKKVLRLSPPSLLPPPSPPCGWVGGLTPLKSPSINLSLAEKAKKKGRWKKKYLFRDGERRRQKCNSCWEGEKLGFFHPCHHDANLHLVYDRVTLLLSE